MTRNYWPFAILLLLLQGCDINYATFVTSTHIGIKADTTTEQVAIGIGSTDLFVGPGYPEKGRHRVRSVTCKPTHRCFHRN